ncbi:UNVERIFIED_CONTAM: hypothetical protein NCL1_32375 [Trichonephila clavipes]
MLNSCIMHRHTGPASVRLTGTLNSQCFISEVLEPVVFLTFRAWPEPYFNRIMRNHTWHALSKGSSSITRLNCFPGRLALRIFR